MKQEAEAAAKAKAKQDAAAVIQGRQRAKREEAASAKAQQEAAVAIQARARGSAARRPPSVVMGVAAGDEPIREETPMWQMKGVEKSALEKTLQEKHAAFAADKAASVKKVRSAEELRAEWVTGLGCAKEYCVIL